MCKAPEITLECFNYNDKLRTIARERIATKAGVCTKAYVFNSTELDKIAQEFIKKIKTPYCFNLQFMKNSNSEFVITDVNLRLAGGMSISFAAGWDEVSALAKIMLEKNESEIFESLPEKIEPQYVIRAYTDIVTKFAKPVVAFDLDGTLLDSRERHKLVLNDILNRYNINLDISDLIEFKRQGYDNVYYLKSKGIQEETALKIQSEWIKNIEKFEYLSKDKLYPYAIDLLNKYAAKNNLILITARNNKVNLIKQIQDLDIKKYFKEIKIVNPGRFAIQEKADVLKNYNAKLMIGDTRNDAESAKIAEVDFRHVDNGFHDKKLIRGYING